jgi:hypothetical protein
VTPRSKRNRSRSGAGAGPLTYQAALATASAAVHLRPVSPSLSIDPEKQIHQVNGRARPVARSKETTGGVSACRGDS